MWDVRYLCSRPVLFPFGCHILTNSKTFTGQSLWAFSSLAHDKITGGQTGLHPQENSGTGDMSATYWSGFILLSHLLTGETTILQQSWKRQSKQRGAQGGGIKEGLLGDFICT